MKIFIEIAYDKSDYTHKLEAIGISGKDERRLVGVQVTEIRFFRHRVKGESAIDMLPVTLVPPPERGYCFQVEQLAMLDICQRSNPGAGVVAFLLGRDCGPCVLYLDADVIGLSGPTYEIVRGTLSGTVYATWSSNATGLVRRRESTMNDAKEDIAAEQRRLAEQLKEAKTATQLDILLKDIVALPLRYRLLQRYWADLTPEQYEKEKEASACCLSSSKEYRYMLLDRLRLECGGYITGKSKTLWAGDAKCQIAAMRTLWNSFEPNKKPVWLPLRDIDEYELKMVYGGSLDEG